MPNGHSFMSSLTLVLLLHGYNFPWPDHMYDRLLVKASELRSLTCTKHVVTSWFQLKLGTSNTHKPILFRTPKLQKLIVSTYLMALSGPVCVWILLSHAGTNLYTYVLRPLKWKQSRGMECASDVSIQRRRICLHSEMDWGRSIHVPAKKKLLISVLLCRCLLSESLFRTKQQILSSFGRPYLLRWPGIQHVWPGF